MEDLTDRQHEILTYIVEHSARRGYPPSVREIGEAVGLSSSSTVHNHLNRLEEKGYIRRDPAKPRAIEVLHHAGMDGSPAVEKRMVQAPIVGRVTAGEPVLAVENIEDTFPLPVDFVGYEDNVFLLEVRGDSMIDAGILDGDHVVVRRQDHAESGDIVVALLDDEATVKRFFREDDHIRLQPANQHMGPIRSRDVQVLGRVIGLLRRVR